MTMGNIITTHANRQARIIAVVRAKPGITRADIAASLGITDKQKITNLAPTLSDMKAAGALRSEKIGNGPFHGYYLTAECEAESYSGLQPEATPPAPPSAKFSREDGINKELNTLAASMAGLLFSRLKEQETLIRSEIDRIVNEHVQSAIAGLPAQIQSLLQTVSQLKAQIHPAPLASPVPPPAAPARDFTAPIQVRPKPRIEVELEQPQQVSFNEAWSGYTPPAKQEAKPAAQPEPPAKKDRMKITIIGLKSGQAHMLRSEFGRQINLSFIESDDGKGAQVGQLAKTNDHIIQLTRFTNHATSEHIKAMGGNLVQISGGMTALRDTLTRLYVEHDDKTKAAGQATTA